MAVDVATDRSVESLDGDMAADVAGKVVEREWECIGR